MKRSIIAFLFLISVLGTKAQKTYADCRTSISSASYSSGSYLVVFTNTSSQSTTYTIYFPNGDVQHPSVSIPPNQVFYYYHQGNYVAGNIYVCPDNATIVYPTCPLACVYRVVTL